MMAPRTIRFGHISVDSTLLTKDDSDYIKLLLGKVMKNSYPLIAQNDNGKPSPTFSKAASCWASSDWPPEYTRVLFCQFWSCSSVWKICSRRFDVKFCIAQCSSKEGWLISMTLLTEITIMYIVVINYVRFISLRATIADDSSHSQSNSVDDY